MNPPFNDPFEEERKARFVAPMEGLLAALELAKADFLSARGISDRERHQTLYERGMNVLFNMLNLGSPVAHVRRKNGGTAFLWIDYADRHKAPPSFRWLVCSADGTWKTGTEPTQEECERVAKGLLEG